MENQCTEATQRRKQRMVFQNGSVPAIDWFGLRDVLSLTPGGMGRADDTEQSGR
jgi:hypothetical protein